MELFYICGYYSVQPTMLLKVKDLKGITFVVLAAVHEQVAMMTFCNIKSKKVNPAIK